jgi:hypothetical protein
MESVKPAIDHETATRLLRDELQLDFENLEEIGEGQISRTYSLDMGGTPCVLQFTEQNMSQGCLNERLFSERFREMGIPVRDVLHEGDFEGLHFTIAAKVQGQGLHQLPPDAFMAILPSVMDMLLKIARTHPTLPDTGGSTRRGTADSLPGESICVRSRPKSQAIFLAGGMNFLIRHFLIGKSSITTTPK